MGLSSTLIGSRFKVQGFFICHIIVIQGITRSEMQSNQVRSVTVQNNKNTNYISNITQGHTYGKKRRNKNKMCNEIKKSLGTSLPFAWQRHSEDSEDGFRSHTHTLTVSLNWSFTAGEPTQTTAREQKPLPTNSQRKEIQTGTRSDQ